MWLVEETDRWLLEQPDQKQPRYESSDVSEPSDSATALSQAKGSLKELNDKVKSQHKSSRDVHHAHKEAQRNQNQNPCPRIEQDVGTQDT